MVYLVTLNTLLYNSDAYAVITPERSLEIMSLWDSYEFDTETRGLDAHIVPILCMQFGYRKDDVQIVVDTDSIDPKIYKEFMEGRLMIGQNLYFDLQFVYMHGIVPMYVYDTMIAEQVLYLGYDYIPVTPEEYASGGYDFPYREMYDKKSGATYYMLSFSLQALCRRYLDIYLDKTVRGQIIYSGLTVPVIDYAAKDVTHLEDIMDKQVEIATEKGCLEAIRIECMFVPVIAYLSWCGIKLDEKVWTDKMKSDNINLKKAIDTLNQFVLDRGDERFINRNIEYSLFEEISDDPQSLIEFPIPGVKATKGNGERMMDFVESLGFDLMTFDKKTKQMKRSLDLKNLKKQKGVCDEFLKVYINYSEAYKVVSTYGITYINAINPITGRIHTQFKQLAADTGRMSCGNEEEDEDIKINADLAKLKGFPLKTDNIFEKCGYPNIQTLPKDEVTRSAFICEEGNVFCSCDWSAIESRLGADIYNEKAMIDEFLYGSGDMHSLVAKMIFPELKDVPVKDIKDLYPKLRSAAKPVEFSQQFGGSAEAIRNSMGCSVEEAQNFADAYNNGFKGIAEFKKKGAKFVKSNGYILLNPITGHKTYWWDWKKWCSIEKSHDSEFWERYRKYHKGTNDSVCKEVSQHFRAASKWERKALNSVTQGTGAICLKVAARKLFEWIVENNLFGIVKIVDLVHDEMCIEYPKEHAEIAKMLEKIMQDTAAEYCKSLPIPAVAEVGNHWIH